MASSCQLPPLRLLRTNLWMLLLISFLLVAHVISSPDVDGQIPLADSYDTKKIAIIGMDNS